MSHSMAKLGLRVDVDKSDKNCRHFTDDIFKCIATNWNAWISLKIPLRITPEVRINNIPALVQIVAWRQVIILTIDD